MIRSTARLGSLEFRPWLLLANPHRGRLNAAGDRIGEDSRRGRQRQPALSLCDGAALGKPRPSFAGLGESHAQARRDLPEIVATVGKSELTCVSANALPLDQPFGFWPGRPRSTLSGSRGAEDRHSAPDGPAGYVQAQGCLTLHSSYPTTTSACLDDRVVQPHVILLVRSPMNAALAGEGASHAYF